MKEIQQTDKMAVAQRSFSGTLLVGVILFLFTIVLINTVDSKVVDATEIHIVNTLHNIEQHGNISAGFQQPGTRLTYLNTKTKCIKWHFEEYMYSISKKCYHIHRRRKRRAVGDNNSAGKNRRLHKLKYR
jgi:hypothetical protein